MVKEENRNPWYVFYIMTGVLSVIPVIGFGMFIWTIIEAKKLGSPKGWKGFGIFFATAILVIVLLVVVYEQFISGF